MLLYDYFRSSASYRVRIALNFKGLAYEKKEVHLVKDGGEQHQASYRQVNCQGRVPSLEDAGDVITQSMAILEYLEEKYPQPPLLPTDITERAHVRAIANLVACDIHPLNNLSVLQYLQNELDVDDAEKQGWYAHWIDTGFTAIEAMLHKSAGTFCFGSDITLADICLVPQVYNAKRFSVSLVHFPLITAIYNRCLEEQAFALAAPES